MLDYAQPLDPGGLVREQALSYLPPSALGCTAFMTMWTLAVLGRVPPTAERGIVSWGDWAREAGNLYPALMAHHHDGWWTPLMAHQSLLGGRLELDLSGHEPPTLTSGACHIAHDIRADTAGGKVIYKTGHVYLAFANANGSWRCIQSGKALGYRDDDGLTSWPRAPGRLLGLLTLPRL